MIAWAAFIFATMGGGFAVIDLYCSAAIDIMPDTCPHPVATSGSYFVDGIIGLGVAVVLWWHFRDEWRFP